MATVNDVLALLKIKATQLSDKDKQIEVLKADLSHSRNRTIEVERNLAGALSPNGATEDQLQEIALAAAAIGGPAPAVPAHVPVGDNRDIDSATQQNSTAPTNTGMAPGMVPGSISSNPGSAPGQASSSFQPNQANIKNPDAPAFTPSVGPLDPNFGSNKMPPKKDPFS